MENLTKEALIKFTDYLLSESDKVTGVFIMTSKKTSIDNTYKIKGYNRGKTRILMAAIETEYNSFHPVYYVINGKRNVKENIGSVKKGAIWLLNHLIDKEYDELLNWYDLTHTGNCIKCNRTLTDAESIEYGMGKTCRNK